MNYVLILLSMLAIACGRVGASEIKSDVINVMIIDTGISNHELLDNVQRDPTYNYVDTHGHGTHVAGIITYGNHIFKEGKVHDLRDKLCPQIKLHSCRYYRPGVDYLKESIKCVKKATEMKMDYINYSGGGTEYNKAEYNAYRDFVATGGKVYAAAGNNATDLTKGEYFPASYGLDSRNGEKLKNFVVVQNMESNGTKHHTSNWHPDAVKEVGVNILSLMPDNSAGWMTGTSQATPAVLHTILRQRCQQLNAKK